MKYAALKMMVSAVALSLGLGATQADENVEAWRLFIADHTNPVVQAVDVESGTVLEKFDIANYASLATSESGKLVFAVQREADIIHILNSGITLESHGDHKDLKISDPKLLDISLKGKAPGHLVSHEDHITAFFDREDEFQVLHESELLRGENRILTFSNQAAHHGVAVGLRRHILVSVPNLEAERKAEDLPPRYGLRVIDVKGNEVQAAVPCTGLHGEATSGQLVAFGCREGVVVATENGTKEPTVKMLEYGSDFPEGRVSFIRGAKAMQFFLGDYGDRRLVLIEPESDEPFYLLDLPTRHVDYILDAAKPQNAYVLTEDGQLHLIDVLKREIVKSQKVTDAYSMDGHWRDPRPRLAVAGDLIALTDPKAGLVRLINSADLQENRTIKIEGQPFDLVAVGGSGLNH